MEVKVPFYNILNMLLTGLIFIGVVGFLFIDLSKSVIESGVLQSLATVGSVVLTICFLAIAYEVGLIINRIGSLMLEPIAKKTKAIPFNDDYVKFNIKRNKYPIMENLSREYALSRTKVVLFVLLAIISLFSPKRILFIVMILLAILYFFSYKKFAEKIVAIMDEPAEKE